ncbi:MAG: glycosyltransferase [Acidobacteria bacterium]|nr:glycosyltransferase [Acidobacteriota bacterium]
MGDPSMVPSDAPAAPMASIVIPSHDGRAWLQRCLPLIGVGSRTSHEVIVSDNGSRDGTAQWLAAAWPAIRRVHAEAALGFAAACNRGAAEARGQVLVFLNNDTEPEAGWLDHLVEPVRRAPQSLVTTARLVRLGDPSVIDSAGDGYAWWGAPFRRGSGGRTTAFGVPRDVFSPCGAACAIARELFDRLGGFDEQLQSNCEDVDLGFRVRIGGGTCRYVPAAVVRHAGSATLGVESANAVRLGQRNLEWVWWASLPWPLLLATLPLHIVYNLLAAAYFLWRGRLGAFVAGKREALAGWPIACRKRRHTMATRRASSLSLLRAMSTPPLLTKWREKRVRLAGGGW